MSTLSVLIQPRFRETLFVRLDVRHLLRPPTRPRGILKHYGDGGVQRQTKRQPG
jgi:hypothetical protein